MSTIATFALLAFVVLGLIAALVIGLSLIWGRSIEYDAPKSHADFLRELVERGMLTLGPPTLSDELHWALRINELGEPFAGAASWPQRTQMFPYDWERDGA